MSAESFMALNEHPSNEILDRYAAQKCPPAQVLEVQAHSFACPVCREKLAQILNAEKAFTALRENFAFNDFSDDPEHLTYEQLEFFADNKADEVEREIAESHLMICAECTKDLADLQLFRKIADAPALKNESINETPEISFWQRIFAFDSIGSFAPVAAILLVAALFGAWFFLLRGTEPGEIAKGNTNQNIPLSNLNAVNNSTAVNSQPETLPSPKVSPTPTEDLPDNQTLYALNDGQLKVDDKGNVQGAENLSPAAQNSIKQSLQSGKISIVNNSLGGGGGVLMSESNPENGVPFALVTPIGKIVKENQPVLRWKPLKDANSYSVAIVDEKFRVVAESGKLTTTNWKTFKPLPRGANYSWQVTATRTDGTEAISPSSPAPQARFRVVEQNLFDDINRLEKSANPSHLALGVLYAKAGLKQEARAEFEKLVKENPNSPLARKLLQSVK